MEVCHFGKKDRNTILKKTHRVTIGRQKGDKKATSSTYRLLLAHSSPTFLQKICLFNTHEGKIISNFFLNTRKKENIINNKVEIIHSMKTYTNHIAGERNLNSVPKQLPLYYDYIPNA